MNWGRNTVSYYSLVGGLDQVTPPLSIDEGRVLDSINYEQYTEGGYKRVDGYERFDGLPAPSEAEYYILDFETGINEPVLETLVSGITSTASGIVIAIVVESGSFTGNDAVGYFVLTNITGEFQDSEALENAAHTVLAASASTADIGTADTDELDSSYSILAIEYARDQIQVVPGEGQILGGNTYKGTKYVFRNNVGSTEAKMFKSSSSGWIECDLGEQIDFEDGTSEFIVGETLAGATGLATIEKVIRITGEWGAGDAEGYLILSSASGGFTASETITSASGSATSATVDSNITLGPSGSFVSVVYNFGGHESTERLYGCDGVNRAWEWDGAVLVPLRTGMADDTPTIVKPHKSHLFLSFSGGSLQHSSINDPYTWSAITGAAEIALGEETTGLQSHMNVLVIQTRNRTALLQGTSSADWSLDLYSSSVGCFSSTSQMIGEPTFMDDRGVMTLSAVQSYGDFITNTISYKQQKLIDQKKLLSISSTFSKSKNQYRIFFSDNTALYMTMKGGKLLGAMPVDLGIPARCAWSAEDETGKEELFLGSDDGYLYQLDSGTSFDGEEVEAFLRLPFNNLKSPRNYKRFRKIILELNTEASPTTEIKFIPDFSYSNPDLPSALTNRFTVAGGGGYWDSDTWEQFYWDAQVVGEAEADIDGDGINMSLIISTNLTYEQPHIIHGVLLHYTTRGLKR